MATEKLSTLTAISPIDGRYRNKTIPLAKFTSEAALNKYRLTIEIEWLIHLASQKAITELPEFSEPEEKLLRDILKKFDIEKNSAEAETIKAIEQTTNHDVKAVEYYLKQQMAKHELLNPHLEFVHFACTSEDINNLSYSLMLKDIRNDILLPALIQLKNKLIKLAHNYAEIPMLSRTHGQSASPTTLGKEFANVAMRLDRQVKNFESIEILGKMNGATGNFNAHLIAYPEVDWIETSNKFIKKLDLIPNLFTTQIEPHDFVAEYMHCLQRANTILIDFARDIWAYISIEYFQQTKKSGEVGSSTMPHKINPIDFENAEGNLGLANALLGFFAEKLPISRWQRDLTDSTVLRNMGTAFAHSYLALLSLDKGLSKLKVNHAVLKADLEKHSEVLAEAVQTVMRRYTIENPYEKLKELTRGNKIDGETLKNFIATLELPSATKQKLTNLTASDYIGLAAKLAKQVK